MPSCLPHFSCALQIGMKILWVEGVVPPSGGVGKWVVCGNEGLTEEGVLMVFVCMFVFQEYEETCLFTKHESLQGDSPRVYPNILKCSLHSLVTKGIRLVGFATRAMVRESPTHYLILNSLAFARGRVILRSHFLILLLLIILISYYILPYFSLLQ